MTSHFKTIPVRDGNGDQQLLYEIRERSGLFGLAVRQRLQLGTGETVLRAGDDYVVASTGEKLVRVQSCG